MENFGEILNKQKEDFCRWFCKYNKLNIIEQEHIVDEFICKYCNKENNPDHFKEELNLCEDCQIESFIKNIDSR